MRFSFRPPDPRFRVELETSRFILRPIGKLELVGDPHGWRTNRRIWRDLYMKKEAMSFSTWLKAGPFPDGRKRFTFAIIPKGTDRPIGYHMIKLLGHLSASNTVGIHDEAWLGKDVAVEAPAPR